MGAIVPFTSSIDSTWNLDLGARNLRLGTWSLELGAWSLELGAWSSELGGNSIEITFGLFAALIIPARRKLRTGNAEPKSKKHHQNSRIDFRGRFPTQIW